MSVPRLAQHVTQMEQPEGEALGSPVGTMETSAELPEGPNWLYELKFDGYRALAFKSYGVAHLRSRNNKSVDSKYPAIMQALARLPDETVIDGEIVALDESSRPSFSALQNGSATAHLCYYVFDVLVTTGRNVL